ncbi:hypothetical protein STEG23_004074, partial [Scotinomys teguina]
MTSLSFLELVKKPTAVTAGSTVTAQGWDWVQELSSEEATSKAKIKQKSERDTEPKDGRTKNKIKP